MFHVSCLSKVPLWEKENLCNAITFEQQQEAAKWKIKAFKRASDINQHDLSVFDSTG